METTDNKSKIITLDATNQKLGRLASEIAVLLQGKKEADYAPNKVGGVVIEVENVNNLSVSDKQMDTKEYQRYSGYPGGQKVLTMKRIVDGKGLAEILRLAVKGMLPKNKLQKLRMKNLIIKEN